MTERFYRRYPARALSGMRTLTLEERGLYNGLLDLIYATQAPLPDDVPWLARKLSTDPRPINRLLKSLVEKGRLCRKSGLLTDLVAEQEMAEARTSAKSRGTFATALPQLPGNSEDKSLKTPDPSLAREKEEREESKPKTKDSSFNGVRELVNLMWAKLPKWMRDKSMPPFYVEAAIRGRAEALELDPMVIATAMLACYNHPKTWEEGGKYAPYPIGFAKDGRDRWLRWVDADPKDPKPQQDGNIRQFRFAMHGDKRYLVPDFVAELPRGDLDVLLLQQVDWASDWKAVGRWRPERGPEPGVKGCRLWPSVAKAFGIALAEEAAA